MAATVQFDLLEFLEWITGIKHKLDSIEGKVDKLIMTGQEALAALAKINDSTNSAAAVVGEIQTLGNQIKTEVETLLANAGTTIPADVASALDAQVTNVGNLAAALGPVKTFLEGVASEGNPTPPPPPPPTM